MIGLCSPQLRIETILHQQFGVIASFNDSAMINHENFVCRADRRQAMCDHDRRHTRGGPREVVENRLFGRAVKCAGRFVEHEQLSTVKDIEGFVYADGHVA